ncbi:PhnB protein [Clostridium cavendishii DSM 21758]|uniref:PhnB protein n=1 Tax=Clostridium cavendishii DSM 21758 TaxID=1121302 RepID=A0A1M6T8G0_9CLOT|nr:VOC family protein [Clostridium cavendishii]SHK53058.1 PhnB protein [Clostridium cavendishii DSM 21758]
MKHIIPNIAVRDCSAALDYYKNIFCAEIKNIQFGDNNPNFKGLEGKIVHSELHINNHCIMYFIDMLTENTTGPNPSVILELESEDELNRIYNELREDATIFFELQKNFLGDFHAVLRDKFGALWALNYSEHCCKNNHS